MHKIMDRVSLIFKVLSGDASDEEKAQLDNWIRQSDENKEEYLNVKLLLENRPAEDDSNVELPEGLLMGRKAADRKFETVVVRAIKYLVILAILVFLLSLIYRSMISKGENRDRGRLSRYREISLNDLMVEKV